MPSGPGPVCKASWGSLMGFAHQRTLQQSKLEGSPEFGPTHCEASNRGGRVLCALDQEPCALRF